MDGSEIGIQRCARRVWEYLQTVPPEDQRPLPPQFSSGFHWFLKGIFVATFEELGANIAIDVDNNVITQNSEPTWTHIPDVPHMADAIPGDPQPPDAVPIAEFLP